MRISDIFGRKKENHILYNDFSSVGVDIHSHLIPGLDDGSPSLVDSLKLIRQFKSLGYRKLITTPHVMVDYYKNNPTNIRKGLTELREAISKEDIDIEVDVAAEYMLDDGFRKVFSAKELMPVNGKFILIELPVFNESPHVSEIIFNLQIEGFQVILAHPERYIYWFRDFSQFERLRDRNVFFAMNAVSLSGFYPHPVKQLAEKMIDLNMIDFIGSDMHSQKYMDAFISSLKSKHLSKLLASGKLLNQTL